MNTRSRRNSHGKSCFHPLYRLYGNRVPHAHTRTEVCITDTFRGNRLKKCTNHRITSRIPSCRNNSSRIMCFCYGIQLTTKVYDTGMNIKTVYRTNALGQYFLCIFLYTSCRSRKNSDLNIFQLFYIFNYRIIIQFRRLILCSVTTNHSCHFKIRCSFQCFQHISTDITISYNGSSNLFHLLFPLLVTYFFKLETKINILHECSIHPLEIYLKK